MQCCLFVAEVDLVMLNGWEILFCMYEMSMQCKEKYPVLVLLQFIHASYILISQLMLPGMQSRMPDPTGDCPACLLYTSIRPRIIIC